MILSVTGGISALRLAECCVQVFYIRVGEILKILSKVSIMVLLSHIEPLGYNAMFIHSHMFVEICHFCT